VEFGVFRGSEGSEWAVGLERYRLVPLSCPSMTVALRIQWTSCIAQSGPRHALVASKFAESVQATMSSAPVEQLRTDYYLHRSSARY
jgi:hypothetical protein